jgi:predicted phosphodiesterase
MRVALLSDIHGNSIALDAVFDDVEAQGGVDAYWVLGDLAAIGPDPVGVLDRLASLSQALYIRGNTDRYLTTGERPKPSPEDCRTDPALWPTRVEVASSLSWTQGAISATGWGTWLAGLPLDSRTTLQDGTRVLCVHASPGWDDGQGVHPGVDIETLRSYVAEGEADLIFVGHTHWPMDVHVDGTHIVNVGSVSNAFAPDLRASYIMLQADGAGYELEHRRVAYDRGAVIAELSRVNHPAAEYIARFMRGKVFPDWARGL